MKSEVQSALSILYPRKTAPLQIQEISPPICYIEHLLLSLLHPNAILVTTTKTPNEGTNCKLQTTGQEMGNEVVGGS